MAVNRADFIRWIRGATHDEARAFSVVHFPDFRPVWRSAVTGAVEPEGFAAKLLNEVEAHAQGLGAGEDDREPTFETIFEALIDRRISPLRARIAELESQLAERRREDEG